MKLWYSFTKELKLSSKGFYFYIEILMAVIIITVLLVFIPEEIKSVSDEYLMLDMPATVEDQFLSPILSSDIDGQIETVELELDDEMIEVRLIESDEQRIYLIDDRDDLIELTKKDRPNASAYISGDDITKLKYEYYIQGYESERLQNLYMIIHSEDIMTISNLAQDQKVVALNENYDNLNSRESALPALLTFNGSMMGLFIIAAYIFLDRQQGVIKAYAVTASKVWHYLMSKVLVLMTVTTLTTLVIVISVMGFRANFLMILLLELLPALFREVRLLLQELKQQRALSFLLWK
jgi:hypothetical protein